MPAEIYEDVLELEIDLLESVPLTADSPESWTSSYPYPWLQKTGRRQTISTRVVILENDYLRVAILPDLGGRIWSILDKRFNRFVLDSPASVELASEGPRGVVLREGLLFSPTSLRPLNELGPVEYNLEEPAEPEDPAMLLISELCSGNGLSYHLTIALAPDEARLQCRHRTLNRCLYMRRYQFEAFCDSYPSRNGNQHGVVLYDERQKAGLFLSKLLVGTIDSAGGYFDRPLPIYPRQVQTLEFEIVPVAGFDSAPFANSEVAVAMEAGKLQLGTVGSRLKHKVVLLTEDGQPLEAPADLYPERLLEMDISGLPSAPKALVLLDPDRNEIIRYSEAMPGRKRFRAPDEVENADEASHVRMMYISMLRDQPVDSIYEDASYWPQYKPMSHVALGIAAMKRKQFSEAAHHLENALLYNAEDHLTWWLKAVAERHTSASEEDRPELLNAHFLAPLEPVLRAESFLRQEHLGKEKNPLVAPIAENPDLLIDVACMLYECGLNEDLFKWVEECLRHREVPMLRYILAAAYLSGSRMEMEAAQQVTSAGKQPVNPPYPWRLVELVVIKRLLGRFPSDQRLRDLNALLGYGLPVIVDVG